MLPKSKPLKIFVIICIIIILAALGWYFFKPKAEKPDYLTAPATQGDIEETVLATGLLQPKQLVSVGAQVSGQVKKMYVKLGDEVKQGQLIAQIDSIRQENDLQNQQAAIDNLQAQKATRIASLNQAQLEFKRQQQMLAQDATSRAEFEGAQAALQTAQANIKAIDAQIVQSKLTLSTARENVGYTRISAPINGTVVAIVTEEGQTVNANQSAPTIVKLAQLQTMTIKAQVSEADVMRINKGQPVYFTTLGEPDRKVYATLNAIEPAPDSISSESSNAATSSSSSTAVYYNALFDVPNPDGRLRIDMTAQVYIVLNQAKQVLTIPAAAIESSSGGKRKNRNKSASSNAESRQTEPSVNSSPAGKQGKPATVRVVDSEGNAQPRQIRVGLNNRITAEVISGLKAGEQVVIADSSDDSNDSAKRSNNRAKSAANRGPMRM